MWHGRESQHQHVPSLIRRFTLSLWIINWKASLSLCLLQCVSLCSPLTLQMVLSIFIDPSPLIRDTHDAPLSLTCLKVSAGSPLSLLLSPSVLQCSQLKQSLGNKGSQLLFFIPPDTAKLWKSSCHSLLLSSRLFCPFFLFLLYFHKFPSLPLSVCTPLLIILFTVHCSSLASFFIQFLSLNALHLIKHSMPYGCEVSPTRTHCVSVHSTPKGRLVLHSHCHPPPPLSLASLERH